MRGFYALPQTPIFAAQTIIFIKTRVSYIALFLLTVFTVTWLPVGLFHQHEEEMHEQALAAHDETHFCDLDLQVCVHHDVDHCGHQAHLEKTQEKCFSCQFHFIKHFDIDKAWEQSVFSVGAIQRADYTSQTPETGSRFISNKGPPSLI